MITFKMTLLAIWLNTLLSAQLQEGDGGNNWLLGVIIIIVGIVLFVVFWQWWQSIEAEDSALDLRTQNAHPGQVLDLDEDAAADDHHAHDDEHGHAEAEPAETEHVEAETAVTVEAEAAPEAAPASAPAPEPEPETPDDLTKIEGIGPKISELLQAAGIGTFVQLAKAETNQLQQVLAEAGSRYRLADPSTWPQQAGLAAAGQWEDLEALQENLKGGRAAE